MRVTLVGRRVRVSRRLPLRSHLINQPPGVRVRVGVRVKLRVRGRN